MILFLKKVTNLELDSALELEELEQPSFVLGRSVHVTVFKSIVKFLFLFFFYMTYLSNGIFSFLYYLVFGLPLRFQFALKILQLFFFFRN